MTLACDNPFAPDRLTQLRYRFVDGSWETLLERLEAVTWRGTIVGPPGSGKSILLEQLVPRLKERGFVPHLLRLTSESDMAEKEAVLTQARNFRAPDFLLLDGAERLTTRQWLPLRVAIAQLAGCVVSVHRTSRLPTVIEASTTPALLEEIVFELSGAKLPSGEAAVIHGRHSGNLRECLRELQERFAG
jgi:hypothetical protein